MQVEYISSNLRVTIDRGATEDVTIIGVEVIGQRSREFSVDPHAVSTLEFRGSDTDFTFGNFLHSARYDCGDNVLAKISQDNVVITTADNGAFKLTF